MALTTSPRPIARPTGPEWDRTVERQRRNEGARRAQIEAAAQAASARNVVLQMQAQPQPDYPSSQTRRLPADLRRLRPVPPAAGPQPKAIPDPLAALDIAAFIRKLSSPLALITAPTMLADGGYYPTPFEVQATAPQKPPNPFPIDYSVTVPDYEPPVDLADLPDLGTEITLDQLPDLDVASAIANRPVRGTAEAREIISATPLPKLNALPLEVSVQVTVVPTASGPALRGRVRARRERPAKKKKDRKVRSANLGTRLLRGALDMFGKASEVKDAYDAVSWAVYVQDENGDIVPALTRLTHREMWAGLAAQDPGLRIDIIGAVENYVLMQISDYAIGKVGQRVDQNALALGWDKDLGLSSISAVGQRSTRLDAYASEIDEGSFQLKEHENAQLSLSRSLIPLLREASGSEAFRASRVSYLFSTS